MQRTQSTSKLSRLVALLVLSATLGIAAPAQAGEAAPGCVATQAEPVCRFACPAFGAVKVAVYGPGEDGWIQGSIACGTPPGTSGYIKGKTVACEEESSPEWIYDEVVDLAWGTVFDDGECSTEMTNDGDGTLGQCILNSGTRAVCSVTRDGLLPEA